MGGGASENNTLTVRGFWARYCRMPFGRLWSPMRDFVTVGSKPLVRFRGIGSAGFPQPNLRATCRWTMATRQSAVCARHSAAAVLGRRVFSAIQSGACYFYAVRRARQCRRYRISSTHQRVKSAQREREPWLLASSLSNAPGMAQRVIDSTRPACKSKRRFGISRVSATGSHCAFPRRKASNDYRCYF